MDVILLRELILIEKYMYKVRTKESENAWKAIADSLNNCQPVFSDSTGPNRFAIRPLGVSND